MTLRNLVIKCSQRYCKEYGSCGSCGGGRIVKKQKKHRNSVEIAEIAESVEVKGEELTS
jgi:hypothetical protein